MCVILSCELKNLFFFIIVLIFIFDNLKFKIGLNLNRCFLKKFFLLILFVSLIVTVIWETYKLNDISGIGGGKLVGLIDLFFVNMGISDNI